jgi:uncharacterized repeat protein (TIGR01451 family)
MDRLASGLTYVSATGTNWTCSNLAQVITCTRSASASNLASGASADIITVTASVDASASGSLNNETKVLPATSETVPETIPVASSNDGYENGNPTPDVTNPSNNDDSKSISVADKIDLTIAKAVTSTGPYYAGTTPNVTYTLSAKNNGPASTTSPDIIVMDRLASGLTYVSATGTNWTCSNSAQVITCTRSASASNLDTVIPNSQADIITVTASIDTNVSGDLVNDALVKPSITEAVPETILLGTTDDGYENGDNIPSGTDPSNNDDSITINSGFVYSLGNRVFKDTNNNGIMDSGELPIAGVVIRLKDSGGADIDPDGSGLATYTQVTTNSDGYYRFDNLKAGDYIVEVVASNFTASGILENMYSSTGASQETDPNLDIDLNDNGLDTPVAGAILSGVVTIGPGSGSEPTNDTDKPASEDYGSGNSTSAFDSIDNNSNLSIDFGFTNYDLALIKTIKNTTANYPGPYLPGQNIIFNVQVKNQGGLDSDNFVVVDKLPVGMSFISATGTDWAVSPCVDNAGILSCSFEGNLTSGQTTNLEIVASVESVPSSNAMYRNTAEISEDSPNYVDIDSSIDTDSGQDLGANTNLTGGNDNMLNHNDIDHDLLVQDLADEDDHDYEDIMITPIFDLALRKQLSTIGTPPMAPTSFYKDQTVSYNITVYNQGNVAADSIAITDYIPSGMSLDTSSTASAGWSQVSATEASYTISSIEPNSSYTITIALKINNDQVSGNILNNFAEISSADDDNNTATTSPIDIDSQSDNDNINDGSLVDDETSGDWKNDNTKDQDDHDIASITLSETYSLGDYVWYDTNSNGLFDSSETPVPNVKAELFMVGNTTALASMNTDSLGKYLFTGLKPNDYYVVFSNLPSGYIFTAQDVNSDSQEDLDSDATSSTGKTRVYSIVDKDILTVDGGIIIEPVIVIPPVIPKPPKTGSNLILISLGIGVGLSVAAVAVSKNRTRFDKKNLES